MADEPRPDISGLLREQLLVGLIEDGIGPAAAEKKTDEIIALAKERGAALREKRLAAEASAGLTQSERRTYQALRARGASVENALSDALDGVDVHDVRASATTGALIGVTGVITPGGNPVCPKCGNWYGPSVTHGCPTVQEDATEAEVNRIARLLMAAWEKAEGKAANVSCVATFADMARAVVKDHTAGSTDA